MTPLERARAYEREHFFAYRDERPLLHLTRPWAG